MCSILYSARPIDLSCGEVKHTPEKASEHIQASFCRIDISDIILFEHIHASFCRTDIGDTILFEHIHVLN